MDYAKLDWKRRQHYTRWKLRALAMRPRLVCQECRGVGGETDPILDDGSGPFYSCGYCEGTGYVDAFRRGQWLAWKRLEAMTK